ncbi:hypothetical protein [Magnetospirillum sp. XM-1]|uniref:hypothetical protein n=1 Tax=Magnetospirillum sp. XM-1 TaxID=1663591 RepID=UPI0008396472|nr:hypothetical protein [Magnetospirillum sp. XM-1]
MGVFDPQPYEQLAKVLKAQGHDGEARRIQIAKEDDRLKRGKMGRWHRVAWRLYGWLAGYGYRRARPLLWLLGAIVLGAIVFWEADRYGIMVPAKERIYMHADYVSKHHIPPEYPRPVWPIYSADLLLPFVDLAQDSYWIPSITGKGWAGWVVTIYMWLHIAFGWIASALFVAGITGLVKRD